jgi:hypothetical protein
MQTDYKQQAKDFLSKYNLILDIREAVPQKSPLWAKDEKHGINYWITISKENATNIKYSFDYWGSIADKENNGRGFAKRPTSYDILACLNTLDENCTFEDFCSSYGYDDDSITAQKTYNAVIIQIDGLKKVLSKEAIEELNNIM